VLCQVSWLPEVASTQLPVVGFALAFSPRADGPPAATAAVDAALAAARAVPGGVVSPGWPAGYTPAAGEPEAGGEAGLAGLTAAVAPSRHLLNPVILRYTCCAPVPPARNVIPEQPVSLRAPQQPRDISSPLLLESAFWGRGVFCALSCSIIPGSQIRACGRVAQQVAVASSCTHTYTQVCCPGGGCKRRREGR
jgi:hypothetical protein